MSEKEAQRERLLERIRRDCGPVILAAIENPKVIEVMVNPDGQIWLDVAGEGMSYTGQDISRASVESLISTSASLLNTTVTREKPILEGEFPLDGSRLEALTEPVVPGPSFALRKKASLVFTIASYVERGILSETGAAALSSAIVERRNIFIIGGTGSGKTTLANAILKGIADLCPEDRLVSIEDTNELQISIANKVSLRTSEDCSITRLLRATMRLRPDRIVVGEVRGGEAYSLLKAWNSGHPGGIATIHANSAQEGLHKLSQYCFEAPEARNFSNEALCRQIASVVDVVLFIEKCSGSPGRAVREICRVSGFNGSSFELSPL